MAVAAIPDAPWERLYDGVAFGMWASTRAAFRVVDLGMGRFRPRRGVLLVSSHRAETDVPLLCPSMYAGGHLSDRSRPRIHFAARDDMFERGFFAGFPPGLPVAARRLVYPLDAGPYLRRVRVHPVPYPSASVLRLGRALGELPPEALLEPLLPETLLDGFDARARKIGHPAPRKASDVLRGEFADLLWEFCTPEQLADPAFGAAWRRRAEEATIAIRSLIDVVRSGEVLLLFPEGRPSPDGAIGPLRKGLETIVRRSGPEAIAPIAIAYDPLTPGRPRAYVAFGSELAPPAEGLEDAVLAALRRTTPLTCGQVVAHELVRAAAAGTDRLATRDLDAALAAECAEAVARDRPVEGVLHVASARRERLTEPLAWAVRSGLASRQGSRHLVLAIERVLADPVLLRAATEYASAREL